MNDSAFDLAFYANVAEILGALTIVGGAAFGLVQLLEFRGQRRDQVAVELMRSFYNPDFSRAVTIVRSLPDDAPASDVRAPETERAALQIAMMYETMGLLVFRRIASFEVAHELTGGLIEVLWRKLHVWVETVRFEQSHPLFAEWFEWFALQCAKPDRVREPAYQRFRDWRP